MTDNNRMPADKHSRKKLVMLYTSIIMLLFFAVIFGSTAIFLYSDRELFRRGLYLVIVIGHAHEQYAH